MGTGQRRFGAVYQRADGRWRGNSYSGRRSLFLLRPHPARHDPQAVPGALGARSGFASQCRNDVARDVRRALTGDHGNSFGAE